MLPRKLLEGLDQQITRQGPADDADFADARGSANISQIRVHPRPISTGSGIADDANLVDND